MQTLILISTLLLGVLPGDTTGGRVEYVASGGTQFSFSFKTLSTSHVKVYRNDAIQSVGFSVSLNANQSSSPGGAVTFTVAPAVGERVRIERTLPTSQDSVWTSFSKASSLELDLDRSAMRDQQLDRRLADHEARVESNAAAASGSTPVAPAGHTVARALQDWLSDTVNVLGFIPQNLHAGIAAKTDTTDLTSYLNLAITLAGTGKMIYFPPGRYNHTGITLQYSITLQGAGWSSTELRNIGASSAGVTLVKQPGSGTVPYGYLVGGQRIIALKLTGTSTGPQVLYNTETHAVLRDVHILQGGGHGIQISTDHHSTRLTVDHCTIEQNAGWGLYAHGNGNRQINAIRIINGTEFTANGLGGIYVWPTADFVLADSVIEDHTGPGIYVYADPTGVGTLIGSSYGVAIERNYFEDNQGGNIKVKTTLAYAPLTQHYMKNLRIEGNYLHQTTVSSGVTAAIVLDCGNDAGGGCGEVTYTGVNLADNYVTTAGTIAFVDFKGAHHGRTTRLHPFHSAEAIGGLTFCQKYLNVGNVTIVEDAPKTGSGAPTFAADFIGQRYLDQGSGIWYTAKSACGDATDWHSGSTLVLQQRSGGDLIVNGSALDGGSWTRIAVTVDPDADGSAERVRVAASTSAAQLYQARAVTAGQTYQLSFDAKLVDSTATAAKFLVWDVTHQTAIVASTSYIAQINTSSYKRIVSRFTIPVGCTSLAVMPVGITTGSSETVDVYIKNVQLFLTTSGLMKFQPGAAVVANGTSTVEVDLTDTAFTSAPYCTASGVTRPGPYKVATTATSLTIDPNYTTTLDETVHYTCIGK